MFKLQWRRRILRFAATNPLHRCAGWPGAAASRDRLGARRARLNLDRAELFVMPLYMARGVQNKLLEALAMGLPCVVSQAALRGTTVADGDGVIAADDPRDFARHLVDLLRDGIRRQKMAGRARAAAEANYRWEAQLARLDEVIATVSADPRRASAGG